MIPWLDDLRLSVHPKHFVGPRERSLVDLWRRCRTTAERVGPLPFAGGAMDQPAGLLAALDFLDGLAARRRAWIADQEQVAGRR